MSDEQDSGSGWVIGIIIGGVAAIVVVVLVFGGFVFWRAAPAPPAFDPGPAIIVAKPDEALPEKRPTPAEVSAAHEQLVGVWVAGGDEKRRPTLTFYKNGTAKWVWPTERDGKPAFESMDDGWEVVDAGKEQIKIRFYAGQRKEFPYDHLLRLDGKDWLIFASPPKDNPRFVIDKEGRATFTRLLPKDTLP